MASFPPEPPARASSDEAIDPATREATAIVQQWLAKAEADMRIARHALTLTDEDRPFDAAAFHAQQGAEKYLKAVLVQHGIEVPRTHDIRLLARRLEEASVLPPGLDVDGARVLTRYAVDTRYPDDIEPIDRAEAETAIALAEGVERSVRAVFKLAG